MGNRYLMSLTVAAASTLLWVATARADDKTDAESQFRAGVSLQKVEDFESAIAAYDSSLRLYPTKSALFNLANCLKATHRYVEALEAFERLEAEYGPTLDESMRGPAEIQRAELRNLIGTLRLRVVPSGAEVLIDGLAVGHSPLPAPLRLGLGDHEIHVRLEGFEPLRRTLNVAASESVELELELQPRTEPKQSAPPAASVPAPTTARPSAPAAPANASSSLSTPGWISVGAGALLIAGGAATGIAALKLDGKLEADCPAGHCSSSRAGDIDRLETLTMTTDLLFGLGTAAAAAGVVMLLLDPDSSAPASQDTSLSFSMGRRFVGAGFEHVFE